MIIVKEIILTLLMSAVPVIELRGGIPYGIASGLEWWEAYPAAVIGNLLPVPFIYLFARKFLLWGAHQRYIGKLCSFFVVKGERAGQRLSARAGRGGLALALMLFVGIPLPGTGAWTGTLAASFLNMGPKATAAAVSAGVVLAGVIMVIVSSLGLHIFGL